MGLLIWLLHMKGYIKKEGDTVIYVGGNEEELQS